MGCIHQAMSCLELNVVKLELSSNSLVRHSIACMPGINFFCKPLNYFFCSGERTNAVSKVRAVPPNVHKIILRTVVMNYFLSKVEDLQPETF